GIGAASRGQLAQASGELLARFDHDDYRGIGVGASGTSEITGLVAIIQDQDATTPETVSLHVYGEQTGVPDFPNLPAASPRGTNPRASIPTFALFGPGPAGPAAVLLTLGFATPLALPSTDVFLGVEVQAASWPTDGISLQVAIGTPPGPAPVIHPSY